MILRKLMTLALVTGTSSFALGGVTYRYDLGASSESSGWAQFNLYDDIHTTPTDPTSSLWTSGLAQYTNPLVNSLANSEPGGVSAMANGSGGGDGSATGDFGSYITVDTTGDYTFTIDAYQHDGNMYGDISVQDVTDSQVLYEVSGNADAFTFGMWDETSTTIHLEQGKIYYIHATAMAWTDPESNDITGGNCDLAFGFN